ncbi:MAG: AAA family ATPase [Anaerolineales bacterium]|nr:AAA family ATPase [Anaerolineales bacterium]
MTRVNDDLLDPSFGTLEHFESLLPKLPEKDDRVFYNPVASITAAAEVVAVNRAGVVPAPEAAPEPPRYLNLGEVRKFYGNVLWEWPGRVPKAQITLIAGETGVGKSWLICALIAAHLGRITYPDGQRGAGRRVVFVETEEMRAAIAERLQTLEVADNDVLFPTNEERDPTYLPSIVKDANAIAALAKQTGATLIVVDSLSGGHALDENGSEMRQVLLTLARIASTTGCPVLVAHHLRKRSAFEDGAVTLDRVRGSSTITQFCRSVFGLWKPEPNSGVARVEQLKSSFAPLSAAFGFEIVDGKLRFAEAPEVPREMTAVDRACEFLRVELRAGPQRFSDLLARAEAEGISKDSLYRAKRQTGVVNIDGRWGLPYSG